jgi:hypothetical protein
MKILYFFLFLWVIFALLDPDLQFECGQWWAKINHLFVKRSFSPENQCFTSNVIDLCPPLELDET